MEWKLTVQDWAYIPTKFNLETSLVSIQLSGVTPIGEWGSLRLRTRFLHDLIMPQDEYSPLKELVLFPRLDVVVTLADICHTDRVPLASSLLRIFRYKNFDFSSSNFEHTCLGLTKKRRTCWPNFPGSRLKGKKRRQPCSGRPLWPPHWWTATWGACAEISFTLLSFQPYTGLEIFWHNFVCSNNLNFRILEAKQSCELNPSKIESPTEACANAEFLLQVSDWPTEPLSSLLTILIEICMEKKVNICPVENSHISKVWND